MAGDEGDETDDEALSWAGDDVRGGVAPMTRNRVLTDIGAVDLDGQELVAIDAPRSLGRAAVTALFAVLFLAVVVGWILSAQLTSSRATGVFAQIASQFGEFVAIISGALWFLAVLTLLPDAPARRRIGWFALGVGVLVPWPYLLFLVSP